MKLYFMSRTSLQISVQIFTLVLLLATFPAHLFSQDSKTFDSPRSEGGKIEACESIILSPGFFFKATTDQSMAFSINRSVCSPRQEQISLGSDKNYILKITPLDASSHAEVINGQLSIDRDSRALVDIQYFDGLGRPIQTVQRGITPSGQDLVSFQTYDAFGRDSAQWLPVPHAGNGSYVPLSTAISAAVNFYGDQKPFSKPVYEASPLDRINEQYGPGQAWHENGKSVKTELLTNTSSEEFICSRFLVSGTRQNPTLTKSYIYNPKELYVTKTEDEDGNISFEFKDKLGQVILTRQLNFGEAHDTYYVYDGFGNLTFVLPPLASDNIPWPIVSHITNESSEVLKQYAYLYRYDHRNRQIAKRIPGADWQYFVYDNANRLVLSQDGEQRKKEEWAFNKYDELGRLIISGVYNDPASHSELQLRFKDKVITEKGAINTLYNYTWDSPPLADQGKILIVHYYDNYNFLQGQSDPIASNLAYKDKTDYDKQYVNPTCNSCSTKGLQTGTIVKRLDNTGEIITTLYYNDKGKVVQKRATNHLGGFDKSWYAYSFSGELIKEHREHLTTLHQSQENYTYEYDHAGRPTKTFRNGEILEELTYDELGKVKRRKQSNLLDTEYSSNIRNWTKRIHEKTSGFEQRLFHEEYIDSNYFPKSNIAFYNRKQAYNGNISGMAWCYSINQWGERSNEKSYVYDYDGLNRLVSGTSINRSDYGPPYQEILYSSSYSYDKHGNITSLMRSISDGEGDFSDIFSMEHQGNLLSNIQYEKNGGMHPYGFNYPIVSASPSDFFHLSFSYDANGRLTRESGRKISTIRYNLLNLPDTIQFENGNAIYYTYDASGVKLSTRHITVRTSLYVPIQVSPGQVRLLQSNEILSDIITDYAGSHIYENGQLERTLISGGYTQPGTQSEDMYLYITDYQGNIRNVVRKSDRAVVEKDEYHPYGTLLPSDQQYSDQQPYKYGGKELDRMHGLNMLDFGARVYDPLLCQWHVPDPLAEKYYSISPYAYCKNNPIKYIDPDGRDIIVLVHGPRDATSVDGGKTNAENHLVGHQAVLIGNDQTGWTYLSYDYDKGENKGSGANSENDVYSDITFKTLEDFKNSEHNTFKTDYDDGKGLETAHKDGKGKIIQRYQEAFQITTDKTTDKKMLDAGRTVLRKPWAQLNTSGEANQCTTVAEKALNAGGLKNGEHRFRKVKIGKKYIYIPEINFLPKAKYDEIKRNNEGEDVSDEFKRDD